MGSSASTPVTAVTAIPAGKTRICVAGSWSPHRQIAHYIAHSVAKAYPEKYETWYYFASSTDFHAFTAKKFEPVPFPEHLKGHGTTPFCWLEKGDDHAITPLGGRDYLAAWTRETFKEDAALMATVDSLSPQNGFSFFLTELTNLGAGHATDPELAQTAALQ